MFKATKPCVTVLVAGGLCAALAACSSSSSSSSSAPAPATTSASAAATPTAAANSATATAAAAIPAADCTIIKQVDGSAITTLSAMQSESKTKAAASMASYLSTLQADQAKLTSAAGKSALGAWITDVQKAATESTSAATTTITGGLGTLGSACT